MGHSGAESLQVRDSDEEGSGTDDHSESTSTGVDEESGDDDHAQSTLTESDEASSDDERSQPTFPDSVVSLCLERTKTLSCMDDYRVWAVLMKMTLELLGLKSVVLTSPSKESEWTSEEWTEKNARAEALILNKVGEGLRWQLTDLTTANEMWESLAASYQQHCRGKAPAVWGQIMRLRMNATGGMEIYVATLRKMFLVLKGAKLDICEHLQALTLLESVPNEYRQAVITGSRGDIEDLKWGFVAKKLIDLDHGFSFRERGKRLRPHSTPAGALDVEEIAGGRGSEVLLHAIKAT